MPKAFHMTWIPAGRRWRKHHKGRSYTVSCKQLGVPETKEASWRAANEWWERQLASPEAPSPDDRVDRAATLARLVRDFSSLDDDARREAVETLLGQGAYDDLKARADSMLAGMDAPAPGRAVAAQVEAWKGLLRSACRSGQISEGRFDAYCRKIRPFAAWIGPGSSIDVIDEARLEAYYNHLSEKVGSGVYSPSTAHELLMTAKQFISRLAELRLIPLPGNIRSRRFRFNHSVAAKIETFTVGEVRDILTACDGFSERTRLYILLMLNCGMYQNDIAELRADEVDWSAGTLTRARSKTRERGGPVVTYRLWPETFALLRQHRSPGDLALTTDEGNPLVKYWIEGESMRRYDAIQSAWSRLATKMGRKIRLGMKHLRKTSATILGQHAHYKFYGNHFLADSPSGMAAKHYMVPSDEEFFEALGWLRGKILGSE
ncbi:tyrosine-type recombinase/integrase [Singulisphaera sp. PoT]|uniref:tyrosine-type recombinase/integrase n=1 Tax=Singulisphaera sp. PoT TaxID=3411797 RepID=UPI003BF4E414